MADQVNAATNGPLPSAIPRRPFSFRRARVRRTPAILQMEALECGAACLAIVLAHHGHWIPLERLRVLCGVSRDGTKANNILKAARGFGLLARGFRKEPAQLFELAMPAIVHWNFNHFVVLEGIRGNHIYINDPAQGHRRVSQEEFSASFTGVVLTFEPTADFRRSGQRSKHLGSMLRMLRHSKTAVALSLFVSLSLIVPGVLIPAFTKVFIDEVLLGSTRDWLGPLLIGLAAAALARTLMTMTQRSLLLRLQTKISVILTARFLWHVLALPMEFFCQRHPGDIAQRVSINDSVAQLLSGTLITVAFNVIAAVFFAAVMTAYDPALTALCIGLSAANTLVFYLASSRRGELNRGVSVGRGKLYSSTVGIIRAIETLKSSGLEDDAFARWAGFQALLLNSEQKLGLYTVIVELFPPLFSALISTAILGVGGWRVMNGELTVGGVVAFQSLAASFCAPIAALVQSAGTYLTIKADLARLEDTFNYPLDPPPLRRVDFAAKLSGRIEISNLQFRYSPLDPPVIDGFSLTIEPGMRVALVGASGSGKSTLARLIVGLNRPSSGDIRFDGVPLREIPAQVFAESVAYVDQDIFLFEGTVRENITLWDEQIREDAITRALSDAVMQDEVAARPGNVSSHVSEGGANFSGGQRQRIELARALVRDPSVLVLDEATAALDAATEKLVGDNLRRRDCTCIIVAHRLSTIRDCDEIIVLEHGTAIERGSHEQLMSLRGAYARLVADL